MPYHSWLSCPPGWNWLGLTQLCYPKLCFQSPQQELVWIPRFLHLTSQIFKISHNKIDDSLPLALALATPCCSTTTSLVTSRISFGSPPLHAPFRNNQKRKYTSLCRTFVFLLSLPKSYLKTTPKQIKHSWTMSKDKVYDESKPVLIIGAGVVGLTLAQGCREAGIPFQIFEQHDESSARSQRWGLSLHWSLKSLERTIGLALQLAFQRSVPYKDQTAKMLIWL
jgi:hypothetical protein